MTKLPALLFVSSLALGCSHAPTAPPEPPPVSGEAPAPVRTQAPTPTPTPTPPAEPEMAIRPAAVAPLHDPERCKRPTRAYPRWCGDVMRERVKAKEEAAQGDPQ